MSTALAVRQEEVASRAIAPAADTAPLSFTDLMAMGDALVGTGFLPRHIKTGAQAAAIILASRELGMQPMRGLRSLAMVEGKVVEAADSQLARFKTDGGRAVFKQLDETGAVLWLRHPNGDEHEERFTIEDARAAGLLGKDVWKKYPKAMLRSRAITAALKSVGWEGGAGVYDPEEAAAFTPPAPGSSNGHSAPSRVVEDEAPLTIETALELPLPGAATAWGNNGGKPLGQLDAKLLRRVRKWIADKIDEAGGDETADPRSVRLRQACDLVLKVKGAAETNGEAKAEPAAGSGGPVATPAAGKVQDALFPEGEQSPGPTSSSPTPSGATTTKATGEPSIAELTKSITRLLEHEKLTPNEKRDFRKSLEAANSLGALQLLMGELEDVIERPF